MTAEQHSTFCPSARGSITITVLLGLTIGVFSCGGGGGQAARDRKAIMGVYDKNPKEFRRKVNRPYHD